MILEFIAGPDRNVVHILSAVLMDELAREEMRVGGGDVDVPCGLSVDEERKICPDETGEVGIAFVDNLCGRSVDSVVETFAPVKIHACPKSPLGSRMELQTRMHVKKVLRAKQRCFGEISAPREKRIEGLKGVVVGIAVATRNRRLQAETRFAPRAFQCITMVSCD